MGFTVIIVVSVLLSLIGGIGLLLVGRTHLPSQTSNWFRIVLGALFSILGAMAVLSAVVNDVVLTVLGSLFGAAFVWVLSKRRTRGENTRPRRNHASTALGAIIVHRTIEGVTLATVYAAGSAVGALGAVVLAGHAVAETTAIGGLYLIAGRVRAIAAIGLVQVGFVVGAVGGRTIGIALIPQHRVTALAVAGGALLVIGGSEIQTHFRSESPTQSDVGRSQ